MNGSVVWVGGRFCQREEARFFFFRSNVGVGVKKDGSAVRMGSFARVVGGRGGSDWGSGGGGGARGYFLGMGLRGKYGGETSDFLFPKYICWGWSMLRVLKW